MNVRLEHIKDEVINNLTMKKVVCPILVRNVSTSREHENDQVSIEELIMFLGGEYIKSVTLLVLMKIMWQARLI
jgi:hypothetical protein